MRYRKGQIAFAPNGGSWVPNPWGDQCRVCGQRPAIDCFGFFSRWLPDNQHSTDFRTRAIVEATKPFEFFAYENWRVALYVKFNMPPQGNPDLRTPADILSGHRFGPFRCFCQADKMVREYFERATGDDPNTATMYPAMREIVES